MINYITDNNSLQIISFLGILAAFLGTCFLTASCSKFLPKDQGRDFAVNGKLSAGKPRGAGFIFILVFIAAFALFGIIRTEYLIYLILVAAAMITGFLDDASKSPWGEYKKGLLDLIIAVMLAVTFLNFNDSTITIELLDQTFTMHPVVFGILTVVLVWTSINVTNCADGVDGLSGTLTIITLMTIYVIDLIKGQGGSFTYMILLFVVCILGYLWFNAAPSTLMMGDAGSRAMGLFISIAVLKTGSPFLYLLVALVLMLDGGLGLVKVSLLRFLKIHILTNTRTPLHDHVRKVWNWSNTHTVFRFAIIQIVISIAAVYLVMI
ncbi:MAG: phospho-N-acetylmuramoyl-pentapeptide-transferase [Lachnospiraceae bacterium]|nr:phospho-N-acetylmuramoyl-pentapeptide-transferase [Lachnospiraceae bacterium]